MAVNLPPQYHDAEAEYKKARTPEEKLAALTKMWVILPKHKASEKVQAILKTKISEATDEVEAVKAGPKKSTTSYKIPHQGAGTIVFLGGPNVTGAEVTGAEAALRTTLPATEIRQLSTVACAGGSTEPRQCILEPRLPPEVYKIISDAIQQTQLGGADPQTTATAASQQLDAFLATYKGAPMM